jgi:hypothetical protein
MNLEIETRMPFGDKEAFMEFLLSNEVAHNTFGAALSRLGHFVTTPNPIGNPMDHPDWLLDHYQRHRDECAPLRISVPDIQSVDLKDEVQFSDWMETHANLHSLQNSALGIFT